MTDIDDQAEEVRGGKGRREDGGGSVNEYQAQDPLFRKLMMWSWGIFGTAFMGMQVWLVSSVADIKSSLPRLNDKDIQIDAHQSATDRRVERLEDRTDALRSRVDQIDGRGMRGAQESVRGK